MNILETKSQFAGLDFIYDDALSRTRTHDPGADGNHRTTIEHFFHVIITVNLWHSSTSATQYIIYNFDDYIIIKLVANGLHFDLFSPRNEPIFFDKRSTGQKSISSISISILETPSFPNGV